MILLNRHVKDKSLGRAVPEMIFDFRPTVDRERRPDVAFVSFDRWASNRQVPQTRSWAVVPDLAIEIVSPTNTADEVAEKLEEYFRVGVRSVWVVYPRQIKVYAYSSPTEVRVLDAGRRAGRRRRLARISRSSGDDLRAGPAVRGVAKFSGGAGGA